MGIRPICLLVDYASFQTKRNDNTNRVAARSEQKEKKQGSTGGSDDGERNEA